MYCGLNLLFRQAHYHSCNSQLYGFNNSSIGKICVAKFEEENGQIIIIQGIGIAMKTCVVFNVIIKKIKLKHPNLTSQILLQCTS
jgi:urea transporter